MDWNNPYQRFGFIVVNVLKGNIQPEDQDLFFGPIHKDDIWIRTEKIWLDQLMAELGIFDSAKEAARHGYKGLIPSGFTDIRNITKKRHRVTILNI